SPLANSEDIISCGLLISPGDGCFLGLRRFRQIATAEPAPPAERRAPSYLAVRYPPFMRRRPKSCGEFLVERGVEVRLPPLCGPCTGQTCQGTLPIVPKVGHSKSEGGF